MEDTITTAPDIQAALDDHKYFNNIPNRWASLEMSQFPHYRVIRLSLGHSFMGFKTIASSYIDYTLQKDGSVYKTYLPAL